jgi:hypothetical protein
MRAANLCSARKQTEFPEWRLCGFDMAVAPYRDPVQRDEDSPLPSLSIRIPKGFAESRKATGTEYAHALRDFLDRQAGVGWPLALVRRISAFARL